MAAAPTHRPTWPPRVVVVATTTPTPKAKVVVAIVASGMTSRVAVAAAVAFESHLSALWQGWTHGADVLQAV
jgi:hypothetical protein